MPAAFQASSAWSSDGRAASRPARPGPRPGMSSVTSIALRSALALIASIRSFEEAVWLATTSTCAAMRRTVLLSEGQLDDFGGHCVLAREQLVAGDGLAAHERQRDRPMHGGDHRGPQPADLLLAPPQDRAHRHRRGEPQPAEVAVRLAAVVQPRDGLLPHVAALGEGHRALVEPGLLRDHR